MDISELNQSLFDKNITCPVCENNFSTKCVKVNSPRIKSKDSDLFIRYSGINPYFYDVWICNKCGYSALKSDFASLKSFEKDLIANHVTSKWKPKEFPDIIDAKLAIDRYKLALITATYAEKPAGTLAFIMLKIGWMYRLLEDESNELIFIKQSLDCFLKAFLTERLPIYGLQRDSLTYLIADLYRRIGNNSEALQWYSKVITTIGASHKIKELARDGKDLIKSSQTLTNYN